MEDNDRKRQILRIREEKKGQLYCVSFLSKREKTKGKKDEETASSDSPVSASSQTPDQGDLGMSMDGRQQGQQPITFRLTQGLTTHTTQIHTSYLDKCIKYTDTLTTKRHKTACS